MQPTSEFCAADLFSAKMAPALRDVVLWERLSKLESACAGDLFDGSSSCMEEILLAFYALVEHGFHRSDTLSSAPTSSHGDRREAAKALAQKLSLVCAAGLMYNAAEFADPSLSSHTVVIANHSSDRQVAAASTHRESQQHVSPSGHLSVESTELPTPHRAEKWELASPPSAPEEDTAAARAQTSAPLQPAPVQAGRERAPAAWYMLLLSLVRQRAADTETTHQPLLPASLQRNFLFSSPELGSVKSYKRALLDCQADVRRLSNVVADLEVQLAAAHDMIAKYQRAYHVITTGGKKIHLAATSGRSSSISPLSRDECGSRSPSQDDFIEAARGNTHTAPLLTDAHDNVQGRHSFSAMLPRVAQQQVRSGETSVVASNIASPVVRSPEQSSFGAPPQISKTSASRSRVPSTSATNNEQKLLRTSPPDAGGSGEVKSVVQGATEVVIQELLSQNAALVTKVAEQSSSIGTLKDHVKYLERQVKELNAATAILVNNNFELSQQYKAVLHGGSGAIHADGEGGAAPSSKQFYSPMLLDGRSAEVLALQSNMDIMKLLGQPDAPAAVSAAAGDWGAAPTGTGVSPPLYAVEMAVTPPVPCIQPFGTASTLQRYPSTLQRQHSAAPSGAGLVFPRLSIGPEMTLPQADTMQHRGSVFTHSAGLLADVPTVHSFAVRRRSAGGPGQTVHFHETNTADNGTYV